MGDNGNFANGTVLETRCEFGVITLYDPFRRGTDHIFAVVCIFSVPSDPKAIPTDLCDLSRVPDGFVTRFSRGSKGVSRHFWSFRYTSVHHLITIPSPSSLPSPTSTEITTSSNKPTLTQTLAALPSSFIATGISTGSTSSTSSGLPPTPPGYKWKPQKGDDIPHAPDAYWPMVAYK